MTFSILLDFYNSIDIHLKYQMKGSARFVKPLLFLAIITIALFFSPKNAFAKLSNCTVTLDTPIVDINSTTSVIFETTNTDNNYGRMLWVSITAPITVPPSDFTIENQGSSQSFSGFDAGVNSPLDEKITVVAGANTVHSSDWLVQVSDDPNGADPTTCDGDSGMQIIDPSTYQPPQLSGVTISNVTDTSVTLSFTTNRDATVELDYGKSDYGQSQTESSPTSSHSFNLSSLTANTTYQFMIKATNDNGETDGSGNFTTAATPYVTSAPQVINTVTTTTVTTTTVKTLTPTPTPTPVPDTTPPSVYVSTDFSKPFVQSPPISGRATDNKQVAKMDYSLDGGHNFLPMDSLSGAGTAATTFSFIPAPLDDGNYQVVVRGIDSSGNIGTSKTYTLVIDRLPPQASGVLFSLGPQIVNPRSDGTVVALAGQPLKITLSDVGGSTGAAILAVNLSNKDDYQTFNLSKDSDNGLWSGAFSLKTGNYQLVFNAIDGASNRTTRNLNKVMVVANGKLSGQNNEVANGKITVYYQEPVTDTWAVWDGAAYSQNNPQITDGNGNYSLFLPPGKYYLHVEAPGFKTSDTEFFTIDTPKPINANFTLSPLKLLFALGPIKIYLPDFSTLSVPFVNNVPTAATQSTNELIGQSTPFFSLSVSGQNSFTSDSLTGKPTVLTFLNTWSPSSTEQISILDKFAQNKDFNSAVIVEGEKVSKVYVFQKRGGYSLPIFADPDATLAIPYNLSFLPVHYFLDRKGVVQKVIYGALNEEELANTLINISQ